MKYIVFLLYRLKIETQTDGECVQVCVCVLAFTQSIPAHNGKQWRAVHHSAARSKTPAHLLLRPEIRIHTYYIFMSLTYSDMLPLNSFRSRLMLRQSIPLYYSWRVKWVCLIYISSQTAASLNTHGGIAHTFNTGWQSTYEETRLWKVGGEQCDADVSAGGELFTLRLLFLQFLCRKSCKSVIRTALRQ